MITTARPSTSPSRSPNKRGEVSMQLLLRKMVTRLPIFAASLVAFRTVYSALTLGDSTIILSPVSPNGSARAERSLQVMEQLQPHLIEEPLIVPENTKKATAATTTTAITTAATFPLSKQEDGDYTPSPCDSVSSLSHFLKLQNHNSTSKKKFSKQHPLCPTAAYHTLHVVIPFYNLTAATLLQAVNSVKHQQYPHDRLQIWLYDDASDNEGAKKSACHNQVLNFSPLEQSSTVEDKDYKEYAQKFAQASGLLEDNHHNHHLHCIYSTQHLGPGGSKFWLFQLVQTVAGANDIIMVVDGDDQLLHSKALDVVNQKYIDDNSWFAYGSMEGKWSEQIQDLPLLVRSGRRPFQPRQQTWVYGHPRTFKAHLLQHIPASDFQYSDGNWLQKGTERGFVFRMLELAGPSRIGYIADKIYQYNYSPTMSTVATLLAELQKAHKEHSSTMPISKPWKLPIHVVLLVWQRLTLLPDQLSFLQAQTHLNGRPLHVHLVNNNLKKKREVDQIVADWNSQQNGNKMAVTLIHMEGTSHHNFARYVYIGQLQKTTPMEQVIFLDDDQYWPPTFVHALLKSHKPKGMTTWYGKSFEVNAPSRNSSWTPDNKQTAVQGLADYWNPVLWQNDLINGKDWPDSRYFKYGGAGGSIIDTNLWLLDSQLQRPARDLQKWAKIDDLWASYVLDGLLGWEIRRLGPDVLPIDIGSFQQKDCHYHILGPKLPPSIFQMLEQKYLSEDSERLNAVATFRDPTVNKQEMFTELQTDFRWNALPDPDENKNKNAGALRKSSDMVIQKTTVGHSRIPPACPITRELDTGYLRLPIKGGGWVGGSSASDAMSAFQGVNKMTSEYCSFRAHAIERNALFVGDSTSRHLFSQLSGVDDKEQVMKNGDNTALLKFGSLQFSFRSRMLRETESTCTRPPCSRNKNAANIEQSTKAITKFARLQDPKSVIVVSIGTQEVLAPKFDLPKLQGDVKGFLELLKAENFAGKLIWWRPHALQEGTLLKSKGAVEVGRRNMRLLSNVIEHFMGKFGALLVDLEYTTTDQVADSDGVHYPHLARQHAIILEHAVHVLQEYSEQEQRRPTRSTTSTMKAKRKRRTQNRRTPVASKY